VVILFALINGVDFTWHVLWMIPLVLELYVFALGIAMLLSALNVKFRDTGYIWEIFLQAAFYATPIIYPLTMVMERSQKAAEILFINPVAQIIQDARYAMISQDASIVRMTDLIHDWRLVIPGFIILLMVTVGVWYFSKKSKFFAEDI
jgi:ABC-type polysaccharide/polyol phosphate export system, permease component